MNNNDILIKPILTEKVNTLKSKGFYGFVVAIGANKIEIRKAIEKLFKVEVSNCATLIRKPKYKMLRNRRGYGKSSKFKIAYVKLKEGSKIEDLEL